MFLGDSNGKGRSLYQPKLGDRQGHRQRLNQGNLLATIAGLYRQTQNFLIAKDDWLQKKQDGTAIANNKLRQLRLLLDGRGLIVVLGRDSSKDPKIPFKIEMAQSTVWRGKTASTR